MDRFTQAVARQLAAIDDDGRLRWHDDPAGFARECIDWPVIDGKRQELTDYQAEILASLAARGRVAVRSLHGAGKTATTALSVLWWAITRDAAGIDWKCVTTAGSHRQLERYLWPEIHKWARRLRFDVIGRDPFDPRTELFKTLLRLDHGEAFTAASDNPELLEGAHASSLLIVLDEAKAIPAGVWDAIEGALSTPGETLALATSTPGAPSGRFYEIHQRKPGLEDWATVHVGLAQAAAAGRVSGAWARQRALQWGERSAVYLNRVLGEFADSDEDGVIPLSWVEAAIERWQAWRDSGEQTSDRPILGVDVGRTTDKSVIALLRGHVVEFLERHGSASTMEVTGHVMRHAREPGARAIVDVIGIGAGPVDRLREQHVSVEAFNASERSTRLDRAGELGFVNRRAEGWWHLRELLDPAHEPTLALPDDDELIGDLCAPKWWVTSAGKVQIESKDEIRKRLGRSTDAGDAVVMACSALRARRRSSEPAAAVPWTSRRLSGGAVPWGGSDAPSHLEEPGAIVTPYAQLPPREDVSRQLDDWLRR